MTVSHGNLKKGSVYIKDGKIAAFGETVNAPASATVVDAGGKYLTPGIIDSHSHIALDDDVKEATSPVTPQMMMLDAFDYQDKAIYRPLAGGVNTSLILHGSAHSSRGTAAAGWPTERSSATAFVWSAQSCFVSGRAFRRSPPSFTQIRPDYYTNRFAIKHLLT